MVLCVIPGCIRSAMGRWAMEAALRLLLSDWFSTIQRRLDALLQQFRAGELPPVTQPTPCPAPRMATPHPQRPQMFHDGEQTAPMRGRVGRVLVAALPMAATASRAEQPRISRWQRAARFQPWRDVAIAHRGRWLRKMAFRHAGSARANRSG